MKGYARLPAACVLCVALAGAACTNPETAKLEYLESGNRFVADGRFDEAIVQYRNALRHDERFGEARWRLAQAFEHTGNAPAALREYVRAADLLPDDVEVQIKAATFLLRFQQFEDAQSRADQALGHDPGNVEALIVRANAMAGQRDVGGAIHEIEEALAAQPPDSRMYTTLGTLRSVGGEVAGAEEAFLKAVETDPSSVEARLALANFYWLGGRSDDVEKVLDDARALDPSHEIVNRMLAAFYLVTDRAPEAEAPLKVVVARVDSVETKLLLADYYLQTRRYSEATAILEPLAQGSNPSGAAMLRLAGIEYNAGRRDAALRMVDELIAREPQNAAALTTLSAWQLEARNVADAVQAARAATEADPSSAAAQLALGRALAANREPEAAITALNEVLRLNPRVTDAQVLLSRLQLASGNPDAAVQYATDASRTVPDDPAVRMALARSLIAQGNLPRAEPEVRALLTEYPQAAATHAVSGALLAARGDAAGARAAFGRALDRDPNSLEALQGLLRLDFAAGRMPAAIARIEERVAKHPDSAALVFLAARTYGAAGQEDKVEKFLRAGLELDPDNLQAYALLGRIYTSQGRLSEALGEFEVAAARQSNAVGAATMAATLLGMLGREDEARKRYEAIVEANPRAAVAANNLAWMYAESGGNLDVALQLAQSAKSQMPDSPEVNDTLGWIYYKQNLPRMAIPPLEQSVAADPTNGGYQFRLGLACAKADQPEKAVAALERALELGGLSQDDAQLARQTLAEQKAR